MLTLTSLLNVEKRDKEAFAVTERAIEICEKLIVEPERVNNLTQVRSLFCEFLKL